MTRLYIALAVAAIIGGILWHDHHMSRLYKAEHARAATLTATLETERENTRKANEATQRLQDRDTQLEASRRDNPLPAVRVCHTPSVPTASPSSPVTGEAAQADHAGENAGDSDAGIDISVKLDDFATDAEHNLNQCEELIRWVNTR